MLLDPGRIGKLELPNRIILSPHATNTGGEQGQVTNDLIAYYTRRAEGGVGAVTIATVRVATTVDNLKIADCQLCIDSNAAIPGFLRLTEAIHKEGSKAIIQVQPGSGGNSAGALGEMERWHPELPLEAVSPSGIALPKRVKARELSTNEVEHIVELTAKGVYRAKLAEFDAVEVNAHALYLISQFMSPVYNKRTDKYGNDRLRFLLEIVGAIRTACGANFPIIVRYTQATWPYPMDETFKEREEVKEAVIFAKRLEEAGVDAIHTSYDFVLDVFPIPSSHWPEDFAIPQAKILKSAVSIPIILTGRIRDPDFAESILHEGCADFIAMARPLIADPDLPKKYAEGRVAEIWSCIACNECGRNVDTHRPVHCTINPTAARELLYDYRKLKLAEGLLKVMVIGGGPAGMEAARTAALKGHQVTLVEKERGLGNKLELASRLPGRKTFKDIVGYYTTTFKALKGNLEIILGNEVTPELVDEMEKEQFMPDVFIVATGGTPFIPECPGIKSRNIISFIDVFNNEAKIGDTVVIIGANIVGCEIALLLASQGKKVTLVELPGFCTKSDIDGADVENNIWAFTEQELRSKSNIHIVTANEIEIITDKSIIFLDIAGNRVSVVWETIVISLGFAPTTELGKYLSNKGKRVYIIGDSNKPGKIKDSIYQGFMVASRI